MEKNDKGLVVALTSALGCALLAIAFLLGRISARPAEVAGAATAPPAAATTAPNFTPTPADPASSPPDAIVTGASFPIAPQITLESARRANPTVAGAGAVMPGSPPSPERTAIAAYFTQIEHIDDLGAGDPQAFATSMLQSVSSGDFSGFDDLVARSKSQRERLRSLSPPRACFEHHRLALVLSGDSVAMLERLKAALAKADTTALMTMATEGHALETQANQLKSMGEAIKRQAGL